MRELAKRQREVLDLAAQGLGIKASAIKLNLAADTVKGYRQSAMQSLHALNITHAVAIAVRAGLLEGVNP
jgi:DNA-binding NarL/FixJ family response regulator